MFSVLKKIAFIFIICGLIALLFRTSDEVEAYSFSLTNPVDKTAVQSNEEIAEQMLGTAISLIYFGEDEMGNQLADSAISIFPTGDMYSNKVSVNLLIGNYKEGFAALDSAIAKNDLSSMGYKAFALMYYLKEYEGAIKVLEEMEEIEKGPATAFAMNTTLLRGIGTKMLGRHEEAIQILDSYINSTMEVNPEIVDVYAYIYKGASHLELGEFEKAAKDFDAFLESYPNGPEGHFYKAKVLIESNKTKEACKCLETALAKIKKGYVRGYIWNELPDQLYKLDVLELQEQHCSK